MVEEESSDFAMLKERWWDSAFVSGMRRFEWEVARLDRTRSRENRVLVIDYFIGCDQSMTVPQVQRGARRNLQPAASGIAWLK